MRDPCQPATGTLRQCQPHSGGPDAVWRDCHRADARSEQSVGQHFPFSRLCIYPHETQTVRTEEDFLTVGRGGRRCTLMTTKARIGQDRCPHRVRQRRTRQCCVHCQRSVAPRRRYWTRCPCACIRIKTDVTSRCSKIEPHSASRFVRNCTPYLSSRIAIQCRNRRPKAPRHPIVNQQSMCGRTKNQPW